LTEGSRESGIGNRDDQNSGPDSRLPTPDSRLPHWSGHWCDVYEAARQGLAVDLELLRAGVDEETWRQEFCCEFLSSGSQWIPHELFEKCVSAEASTDFKSSEFGVRSSVYAGWDVARNRDLSVIWLLELVGD